MFKGRASQLTRFKTLMLAAAVLTACGDDISTETEIVAIDTRTPTEDWQLVWSDEFDGSALDLSKWTYEIDCWGGGNNEAQCYTDSPENLFLDNGILNIVARPAPDDPELTKPYTSSRIVTKDKGDWKYGRIEIMAKAPTGQGVFAAGWMLPTDQVYGGWPLSGEIDILEFVNTGVERADGDIDAHVHGTLHYGPMVGGNHDYTGGDYKFPEGSSPDSAFHLYAIEWEEGEIRWYVDDVLFAYQRDSEVTYRATDGEAAGLATKGWYTVQVDENDEQQTLYEKAPYDQRFHLLLNYAVGGNWASNSHQASQYVVGDDKGTVVNGVDHSVYENGSTLMVDYVRVYQCSKDPETGKGCATISSDYYADTYVRGAAPVPIPPVIPVPVGIDVFAEDASGWETLGETEAAVTDSGDEEYGEVVEFTVTNDSGELGFSGTEYDATLLPDEAKIEFDIKVVSAPTDETATWVFKVESAPAEVEGEGNKFTPAAREAVSSATTVELSLEDSVEGVLPTIGEWQHYTFEMGALRELGLNDEQISAIKLYPTVGKGEGAVYQMDNVTIGAAFEGAKLTLFDEAENPNWPMWDDQVAQGISDIVPIVVADEDPAYGNVAEFHIAGNSVVGFNVREDQGGSGYPFDGSSLAVTGAIEFDLKMIAEPANPNAPWYVKIESNGGTALGGTAEEQRLSEAPVLDQWMHYAIPLAPMVEEGFDISAIDVLLVFPQWGQGDGAKFRLDNVVIHSALVEGEEEEEKGPDLTVYQNVFAIYNDDARNGWSLWDCCAGSVPSEVESDDPARGEVVEFEINAGPDGGTVVGFFGRSSGSSLDVSEITNNGVLRFDLKVENMPADDTTDWLLKVEAKNGTAAELNLNESKQGEVPRLGEWQEYSFPLIDLASAGLDLTQIDIFMMFPRWSEGTGAVFRVDNVFIGIPEDDTNPYPADDFGAGGDTGGDNGGDNGTGGENGELVGSGSFDSTSGWGGTDGMVASIADGVFTVDVGAAGNPWDVSLKYNVTLQSDATYTLTFDARSDDARSIIAGLGLDYDPWTNATETVALSNEWTTYTLTLTTTGFGGENNRVFFDMGAEAGHVQLDNVSLKLVGGDDSGDNGGSGELIANSTLDTAEGWGGTDGMVDSIADGVFTADVAVAGNPWDVSLKYNVTLAQDTTYTLKFDARSDDARDIIAAIGLDYDPWTNAAETVTLTTEWTTYTLTLTTTGFGGENNRVFFDMGAAAGQVQLDNISLMTEGSGDSGDNAGVELISNTSLDSSDGWGGTDGMADSIADGVFTADVAAAGNPWDVSLKYNLTLTQDTTYTLKFDARSDDARDIIAAIGLDYDPWTNAAETVTLTTEWTTYTLTLTSTGFGGENNRVFFDMGAAAGQVQLDNISLMVAGSDNSDNSGDNSSDDTSDLVGDGVELVATGTMDSSDGWGGTDGMADSISGGVFTADVAVAGNPWDVSLKYNLTLAQDTTYILKFDARSDDARDIIAGLGLDYDPWTNTVETVSLTTEWATYTLTLTSTGFGGENNRILFDMGAAAGQVQIDNVSLMVAVATDSGDDSSDAGAELISNTTFDTADGWGGTDGMADSISGGVFTADVAVAGNPWDVSLKYNLTLTADTTYTLKFDARSDDARDIIAGLGLDYDPWTNAVETVTLTNEWATYTLTLTTTGFGGDNNRVFFDMGAAAGQVQLDNVSLMVAGSDDSSDASGELLVNGTFDSSDSWGGTDGMADSIADGVFTADVAVAGNPWDVSLKQNLTLAADTTYTLTFDARSDDSRDMIVGLGLDYDPWTSATATVTLSPTWTTYTVTLTTTGFGGDNNRVLFDMGAAAGQVVLDNVSLMVAADDGSSDDSSDDSGSEMGVATTLFADALAANWGIWDCCAGSTPVEVQDDDSDYGTVAEFTVNGDTVMGFNGRDNGGSLNATGLTTFKFDMKVVSLPTQTDAPWMLKIESGNAGSYVEVNVNTSIEAANPAEGVWQTYTFNLADLETAGVSFDVSNIDIVMVFPAWGQGAGATYRIDNVEFY